MFYCDECRVKNAWPSAFTYSQGKCECCGKSARCWDRPSSSLPPVPFAAPVSAPLDTQALPPPLHRTVTHPDGSTSTYISEYENELEHDLAAIRDLFAVPESGELHGLWSESCSEPRAVVAYAKAQFDTQAARIAHLERELKQARLQHLADIGQDIERKLSE